MNDTKKEILYSKTFNFDLILGMLNSICIRAKIIQEGEEDAEFRRDYLSWLEEIEKKSGEGILTVFLQKLSSERFRLTKPSTLFGRATLTPWIGDKGENKAFWNEKLVIGLEQVISVKTTKGRESPKTHLAYRVDYDDGGNNNNNNNNSKGLHINLVLTLPGDRKLEFAVMANPVSRHFGCAQEDFPFLAEFIKYKFWLKMTLSYAYWRSHSQNSEEALKENFEENKKEIELFKYLAGEKYNFDKIKKEVIEGMNDKGMKESISKLEEEYKFLVAICDDPEARHIIIENVIKVRTKHKIQGSLIIGQEIDSDKIDSITSSEAEALSQFSPLGNIPSRNVALSQRDAEKVEKRKKKKMMELGTEAKGSSNRDLLLRPKPSKQIEEPTKRSSSSSSSSSSSASSPFFLLSQGDTDKAEKRRKKKTTELDEKTRPSNRDPHNPSYRRK